MRTTLWAALAMFTLGPAFAGTTCKFEAQRARRESAQGITRVVLVAHAGDLRVLGSRNAKHIDASGRACASSRELLEQINIITRREGSTLFVEATTPNATRISGWFESSLDFSITLPDTVSVDAQDSSGDATFEDLQGLKLNDGSGDVRIRRIASAIDVTDGSGNISVDQVGSISLVDDSGDISVERVASNVEIVADGSGDIYLRDVTGSAHVMEDGSGDIDIGHVRGSATVDNDSSGRIYASQIGGDFTVHSDSSGGIKYRNVRGKVAIPRLTSSLHGAGQ